MSSTAVLTRPPQRGWSEQRTLAANTILALLIAVVGLLVAGSLSLTTHAEVGTARHTRPLPRAVDETDGRRSADLQAALLGEVAAQRGDALAQQAQTITRAALAAAGTVRQQKLAADQGVLSAAAARIAQQRLQAAVAARVAALQAQAQAQSPLPDRTSSGQAQTPVTSTAGTLPVQTRGVLPIQSGIVGAKFGEYGHWSRYHTGLDFRAAYGTPIHSVLPGVVVFAGSSGDWSGTHVAVRHSDGRTTMYSHMSRLGVSLGQTVQAGQVLGYVGQTGRAFGPHLHFELYPAGVRFGDVYRATDPTSWLASIGVRTH